MADTEKKQKSGFFRTLFNVKRWVASDQIVAYGKAITTQTRDIFKPQTPAFAETFEEAVKRFNLTEKDIVERTKQFLLLARVYFVIAIVVFGYAIYSLFLGYFSTLLVSLVLSAFVGAQALREHFWYMQMKKRQLGCNFKDWRKFVFGVKK